MAKKDGQSLEEAIQQELDSYYNNAVENKQQTDYYVHLTIIVNLITAVIGFVKFSFIANPAMIIGLIAIGMAALTSFWRYHNPSEKFANSMRAYNSLQKEYDEFQLSSGDYADKSYSERKKRLRAQIISIRHNYTDKTITNTIDAINKILTENEK